MEKILHIEDFPLPHLRTGHWSNKYLLFCKIQRPRPLGLI